MRTAIGPLNATDQSIRTSVTSGPCLVVVIRATVAVRRAKVSFRLNTCLGDVSLQKSNYAMWLDAAIELQQCHTHVTEINCGSALATGATAKV
jgi:hypothetical protein